MAKMTKEQQSEIKLLTRRANRRIERASAGQRKAMEYYIGSDKFSAASKGFSYEQAQAQIEKLNKFLAGRSTTKTGWKEVKQANVSKANKTLGKMGYDLTDEELAEILIQIDSSNTESFYRSINLVQAAKYEAELEGDIWKGTSDQISEAIAQKMEASEALEAALRGREAIKAQRKAAKKKEEEMQTRRRKVALSIGKNPRKR